jgi:hypothetical protein
MAQARLSPWVFLVFVVTLWRGHSDFQYHPSKGQWCMPAVKLRTFDNVSYLPPKTMEPCMIASMNALLGINREATSVTHRRMSANVEVLLLAENRGSIKYLEVMTSGDNAKFGTSETRTPLATFSSHSCLNPEKFCSVVSATPIETGFIAIDRHRILRFNFTWLSTGAEIAAPRRIATYGKFNIQQQRNAADWWRQLYFPSDIIEFRLKNLSWISDDFEVTPLFKNSFNNIWRGYSPHYAFLTDTGNNRVVMFDITKEAEIKMVTFWPQGKGIGQTGWTGQKKSGTDGFNWPVGVAVNAPGAESWEMPCLANVYVADSLNDRLVKLNLLDDEQGIHFVWGGEYGNSPSVRGGQRGLTRPIGVGTYRHYIIVAEAGGNAITILMLDYTDTSKFIFVQHLQPVLGRWLTGKMSATSDGYIWYTLVQEPGIFSLASIFLDEALRESKPPSLIKDLKAKCVNETWYNNLRFNFSRMVPHMVNLFNVAGLNWRHENWRASGIEEGDERAYVEWESFNVTSPAPGNFNYELMNRTVYGGSMFFCAPPPRPTVPPMMGSGAGGAGDGVAGGPGGALRGAARRRWSSPGATWTAVVAAVTVATARFLSF